MTNILNLSDAANKYRITIVTSSERTIKVYFHKQLVKFVELGNRFWSLIPNDNSFFKECDKAAKKVKFNNKGEVTSDKKFSVQSLDNKSANRYIQHMTGVEHNKNPFQRPSRQEQRELEKLIK